MCIICINISATWVDILYLVSTTIIGLLISFVGSKLIYHQLYVFGFVLLIMCTYAMIHFITDSYISKNNFYQYSQICVTYWKIYIFLLISSIAHFYCSVFLYLCGLWSNFYRMWCHRWYVISSYAYLRISNCLYYLSCNFRLVILFRMNFIRYNIFLI